MRSPQHSSNGLASFFVLASLSALVPAYGQPGVSLSYGLSGLSSLTYNGTQFLSDGAFHLNEVTFQNPGQTTTYPGSTASTVTVDPVAQTQTQTYSWGNIVTKYFASGSDLNFTVTVTNQSSAAIVEMWFQPISLVFPSSVQEYDGNTPLLVWTLGQPAVQTMTYSGGALALAADDVALPLLLGFPTPANRPTSTIFPLLLNTGRVSSTSYPSSLPYIARPIQAGASDQYHFSLRFGPSGSTRYTLAPDVFEAYAAAYPATLSWNDHRSIGSVIIGSIEIGSVANPRGWLPASASQIDVTTPAGVANFRSLMLTFAKNTAAILQNMNSQGMITWDIEGEQFPLGTTYVCDPRVFAQTAPEMAGIADDYFRIFRNAGLRVGVCIRPQQFVLPSGSTPAQQLTLTDPTQILQTLIAKATYARDRWGATLFYVDSNVDSNGNTLDPSIFASLQAAFPDSLFFPEHAGTGYWAYSAPYRQLNLGVVSTPADARFTYPSAFTLINTADGAIQQQYPTLVQSVSLGDVLMYRSWFDDQPAHSLITSIYQAATTPGVQVFASPSVIGQNQTSQLSAVVVGNANKQVTWSLVPATGSISPSGLYTAPSTVNAVKTVTVAATSVGDPTKSGSTTITLFPQGYPASISASSGGGQSATVNTAFGSALQATVLDVFNQPVGGASVTFTAPAVGARATFNGSASAVATTNSSGVAVSPILTASAAAGSYTVTAAVASLSAGFTLTNVAGPVAAIVATGGGPQATFVNTAFSNNLSVIANDALVNPVSGVTLTFTAPSSGASATMGGLTTLNIASGFNGAASVPAVANGTAGAYAVTASASGATSASFSLTNKTPASAGGSLSGTADGNSTPVNLTSEGNADWVHWEFGYQDRKAGVAPQISTYSPFGGAIVLGYSGDMRPISWTDGSARQTVANDTNGVYVGGFLTGLSFTVPADTAPRTLVIHAGGYNSSALFTASLSDGSAPVYTDLTPFSSGSFDRNYTLVFNAGSAGQTLTVTWMLVSGAGNVTLNAAALSAPSVIGTAGNSQSAVVNSIFGTPLQVLVADANNNPISGATVNFASPATGASATFGGLPAASATTNSAGVAIAPALTANGMAGPYTVTASVAGILTTGNFQLTNTAGVPAAISVTAGSPQATYANTAFGVPLSATVVDANSNPVSGVSVAFAAPTSGASAVFQGASTVTTSNSGLAVAPSLIANTQGGTYTVTASVAGLTPASFTLTNISRSPAAISATAGNMQSAVVNTTFGILLRATVTDSGNNPIGGITVTFTPPLTGPSGVFMGSSTASVMTDVNGNATAPAFTANGQAGPSYTVTATVAGLATAASFTLTNTPGVPTAIAVSAGNSQSATVNTSFTMLLRALVKDAGGNPLSGVAVTFTAPAAGPSAAFAGSSQVTAVTGADGTAAATALTANGRSGTYAITASVAGVSTPASFSLTNIAGPPAAIVAAAGTPQSATVGMAFTTSLQAMVTDMANNPVAGASVIFNSPASPAGATFGGAATITVLTDTNGLATAAAAANGQTGAYSVSATVSGTTLTVSFSLTNTPMGLVTGAGTSAAGTVNLTAEGSSDWIHWGDASLTRKNGVAAQISNYTVVGAGPVMPYNNDPRTLSWTDGTPVASGSNNDGLYINSVQNGFSFTAPADLNTRILVVHVGGWMSGGTLTASLSDKSAPSYVDITIPTGGQYDRNYTLTYQAGSASQTLTVTWVSTSGGGNVTLNGAALTLPAPF